MGGGEEPRRSSRTASAKWVHPGHLDIEPNNGVQHSLGARDEVFGVVHPLPVGEASSMTDEVS